MAKAVGRVIVDHADRLHEGVANGRSHEREAESFQVPAHRVRFRAARRHLRQRGPGVLPGLTIHVTPQEGVESAVLFLNGQVALGVADGRLNLEAVAHDAGIGEQASDLRGIIAGDPFRVEMVEHRAVALPLAQDGEPVEAGLRAFENQHFEQPAVIVERRSPFLVVIAYIQRIGSAPGAAFGFHRALPI